MRKLIDIPDSLIDALKQAAEKEHRTPKSWIEHLVITTLPEPDSKKTFKRTKNKIMKTKAIILLVGMLTIFGGISAQNIGDTITLKAGGKLKDDPLAIESKLLENNTKIVLLKKADYGYYQVETNGEIGYISEVWLEQSGYSLPKLKPKTVFERYISKYGLPDKKTSFRSEGYASQTYIWYCTKGRYRSVEFIYENNSWAFDSEYTSDCL